VSAQLRQPIVPQPAIPFGIHPNLPGSAYYKRTLGEASKSGLDQVARSPAHYLAWVTDPEADAPPTPAMKFGTAFHCAVLEPERFAREYVVLPDFGPLQSSTNRAKRDAWIAERGHPECLSQSDYDTVRWMRDSVLSHPVAAPLFNGEGESELTLSWQDEETGLPCKARVDRALRHKRVAADLKSCIDGSLEPFARAAHNYGMHRQHAFYATGFAALGEPLDFFGFVPVEKVRPYACAVYQLTREDVEKGARLIRRDLRRLADAVSTGEFPAYPMADLALPAFAHYELEA